MLWIYIEETTRFSSPSSRRELHKAYIGAGGRATYHLLPPFGSNVH
jgi:hypothetical protein